MKLLLLFLGVFFFLALVMRVSVWLSMTCAGLTVFLVGGLPIAMFSQGMYNALDSFSWLAVPFFMMAGTLMEYTGISEGLVSWIDVFVGRLRGKLGYVTILASTAFGVLTGSGAATIMAIGGMLTPEMKKEGYRSGYIAALLGATCFLGFLIPPSVPGILYAMTAGAPVDKVWLSTLLPGLIFAAGYCVINKFRYGRGPKPDLPRFKPDLFAKKLGRQTVEAIPVLIMPLIIFGGIYGGVFTATEAGAVCTLYGIIFYFYQKYVKKVGISASLWSMAKTSALTTGVICITSIATNLGTRSIALSGATAQLTTFLSTHFGTRFTFLIALNILLLILGTFLDINSAILLITPLLLPAAKTFGISEIQFGAILIINMSVGFLTPPFAGGIFISCKITGAEFGEAVREGLPFLAWGLVVIILITYFPWLTTWMV